MNAVITGIGVVSPYGVGLSRFWKAIGLGESGLRPITRFDASPYRNILGGEVPASFNTGTMPRAWAYVQEAAREAAGAAGWTWEERAAVGVVLGTNFNGQLALQDAFRKYRAGKADIDLSGVLADGPAAAVRSGAGLDPGPSALLSLACASGGAALATALEWLRAGRVKRVLAGAFDSLSEYSYAGLSALRAISRDTIRPFDKNRDGAIFSEGAAMFAVESEESARRRNASPIVGLAGAGLNNDAYHLTAPHPDARGVADVMRAALADAGLPPEAVDHVNLHGTATPYNDAAEARAMREVFGARAPSIPCTANKSLFGHAMGAAGALEAAATAMSLCCGLIPPTINTVEPDPELALDVVRWTARAVSARVALSNSYGLGGANACVVLSAYGEGSDCYRQIAGDKNARAYK